MNTINDLKIEEKLLRLRIKWSKAKKEGDTVMMSIYERQARALELGRKNEKDM